MTTEQQQAPIAPQFAPPSALAPGAQSHIAFSQRVAALRAQARRQVAVGTTLTNIVATLILVLSLIASLWISTVALAFALFNPGPATIALVAAGIALFGGGTVYGVHILLSNYRLYWRHYREAWQLLLHTDVAKMIALEDGWRQIPELLNQRSMVKAASGARYRQFEEHLAFCACHLKALELVSRGQVPGHWLLWRGQLGFNTRKLYTQSVWMYVVGGCVTLILREVGYLFALFFASQSLRFIISRATLVAICDFILEQPEMDISQLPPLAKGKK